MGRKSKLQESGYHPTGAEFNKYAPYSQSKINQEVVVSLTISKKFKVNAYRDSSDYDVLTSIPEFISLEDNLESDGWSIDEAAVVVE